MRRRAPIALLVPFLVLTACPKEEAPPATAEPTIDWSTAFSHEVAYDAERGGIVAKVRIAPGFHAYTVGETTGRPLKLAAEAPVVLGDVQYPKGIEKNLPIGRSVIVEGDAEIFAPIAEKPEGTQKVEGVLDYQICTDEVCDRPRKAPFSLSPP